MAHRGDQATKSFAFTGVLAPAQITADQDDYNPTGLADTFGLRLTTSGTFRLNGLVGGTEGRMVLISNAGSNTLIVSKEALTSTAANRFEMVGDLVMLPGSDALFHYDGGSSRWSLVGGGVLPQGAGSLRQTAFSEITVNTTTTQTSFPAATTIAAGSNGQSLPAPGGVINVVSTALVASNPVQAAFPTSGTIRVWTSTGFQTVTYTGVTATSFTGCTGGTGVMTTGNGVLAAASAQDFLTINILTQPGANLQINFSAGVSNSANNASVYIRMVIDGLPKRGTQYKANGGNAATGGAIIYRVSNVAAVTHSIIMQFRCDSGTAQIRPVAAVESEHACLQVQEVSV